ncbi:DsbA family protein [Virgibacillus sp. C22-A2]|uniref:DsbA family protein n=1 Tax=Virgibacillus tibetensis TaxID=3042313 RepID=A0ABU6KK57_9BACI|nr:DsbA family protein [Virgibacillus sp. C22-A2]
MKTNKSPLKTIVIITLAVVVLIVALVMIVNSNSETGEGDSLVKQPPTEGQPTLGDSDAPVTVVEFGDFKCPSCKLWGDNFFPQLIEDYVDTGKVQFAYINVLFHGEESKLGSLAAESVYKQNPEVYWDFHKGIYDKQAGGHDTEWLTMETILEVADGISGIDTEQLESDVKNNTEIDEVNKDTELVTEFNVELTPTIMVNNIMIEDPFDYDAIANAIESELEGN